MIFNQYNTDTRDQTITNGPQILLKDQHFHSNVFMDHKLWLSELLDSWLDLEDEIFITFYEVRWSARSIKH